METSRLKRTLPEPEGNNERMESTQHQLPTTQEPGLRFRCSERTQKFPTEVEWARHRQKIKQLYMDEDRTLHDVMEIMKRDFGFDVT